MGIFSGFKLAEKAVSLTPNDAARTGIRSPWTTGQLSKIVLGDIFGTDNMIVSRAEAMSVPPVAKARLLITGLSANPMRAYRGETLVKPQPSFLYRTSTALAPVVRMLWTLDDLLFAGWSLWAVERGTRGNILDAVRVPPEMWSFDSHGRVTVDGKVQDADEVVLFSGPHEGLLEIAARTVRAARNLEETWANRVRSPLPLVELRQTLDEQLTPDEVDQLLDAYVKARRDPDGAVAFVPYGVELHPHGDVQTDLFVAARNAIRVDVANFTGLPASLLDGSLATSTLTYATSEGKRNEFLDAARSVWLAPIEARLSQDDVVPAGQRVAFDLSSLMDIPATGLGPQRED